MKKDAGIIREVGELSVIGLTLVIATLIGYYIGSRIDGYWPHIAPWGMVGGLLAGIAAGFMEMFRTIRKMNRRLDRQNAEDGNAHERQSGDT